MAKLSVAVRASENVTPPVLAEEDYSQCGAEQEPLTGLPATYTDYRTPGSWGSVYYFGTPTHSNQKVITEYTFLRSGHSYHLLLGAAANGPGEVPEIHKHSVVFTPETLIRDPGIIFESNSEGKATINLHQGTTLIKQVTGDFGSTAFSARVPKNGWCTLDADAQRWNPDGSVPAGILSSRVTVHWRFRFAPATDGPSYGQQAPVTVTTFRPQRLGQDNNGPASGTTTVKFTVTTPVYRLKTIHVLASFDDGITWHSLTATKHGGYWLATVRNPASGYVSLRSIVTDVRGDSTTETIYRAYAVN